MKLPEPDKALKLYYTRTEINNAEIRDLFGCAQSTATRLKRQVQLEMAKLGVKTWLPGNIDVKTAYAVWKIDVDRLEKQLAKLQKLRAAGIIEDHTHEY